MNKLANINSCAKCPFSIYTLYFNGDFKSMCPFKKVWHKIPAIMFKSVWLENRNIKI